MSHRAPPLVAVAFGADPGRWPLPSASTPRELWLRAVAAGAQGRYGSAHADLDRLHRLVPTGELASLGCSTRASFLRQLGGHTPARYWDGRALALAPTGGCESLVDALLGLAADALGVGRFATSAALLARARQTGTEPQLPARLALRERWVSAELAMARGDGNEAVRHGRRAVELAADHPSARHRVKTTIVWAAALCSRGDLDGSRIAADEALATTAQLGLVPLRWAAASLLAGIGSNAYSAADVRDVRDSCAAAVRAAGGVWQS